jgi:hypothetical protein
MCRVHCQLWPQASTRDLRMYLMDKGAMLCQEVQWQDSGAWEGYDFGM